MAKLTLLVFTIAAFLALASAHRTIVTTTIADDTNPSSPQCGQQLQSQPFWQCQTHLQQPESLFPIPFPLPFSQQQQTLQGCCQELRNVNPRCHCNAVKKIYGEVQQQQEQQGGIFGGIFGPMQTQRLKQRVENLPNKCNIYTGTQCRVMTEGQCRQEVQGRPFSRCQRYLEQQTGSGYASNSEEMREQCCQELRNVEVECQCEAMKEVLNEAQRMQYQRPEMPWMVEDLKNKCNLEVQQCQLSSRMF
ncbi:hypothetical protein OSB04_030672 [Centaurea solstitialis]|uniref:Bifunctional inhibitor/plant lipid transfer protein/seed storage helical domain-containing protein n=1 Tax=Centaurea solstitialis TaxID=347529 RepID=A0AA38S991_9ASTR|nr:hypothetical protein OSB04_030672 [Centaurea solstitialis]